MDGTRRDQGGSQGNEHEARLVERLRQGDEQAFEILVRTYSGRMLAVARRFVRHEDDARDVVQDAFVSALRGLAGFEGQAQLGTWLHRVVVNAALMRLRTRRRRPEESLEPLLPRFQEDGHHVETFTSWSSGGEELIAQREARDVVRAAIDELPDSYRIVLLLRDIEERSTEETARALGITENAVKIRLHRARQALATLIGPRLGRARARRTATTDARQGERTPGTGFARQLRTGSCEVALARVAASPA